MARALVILLLVGLIGCSRPAFFQRIISLEDGTFNPITRTISGNGLIISIHEYCHPDRECEARNWSIKIADKLIKADDPFKLPRPEHTE